MLSPISQVKDRYNKVMNEWPQFYGTSECWDFVSGDSQEETISNFVAGVAAVSGIKPEIASPLAI